MAGHAHFARTAIQKCEQALKVSGLSIQETIESVLEEQYRRSVFGHPLCSTDHSLAYWFLISIWSETTGLKLFSTCETSLNEVQDSECLGVGQNVAQHIIKPSYYPRMTEREVVILATYALELAKEFVPGCGGESQLLFIGNDGSIKRHRPEAIEREQRRLKDCDRAMRTLLLAATNLDFRESQFEGCIASFGGSVRKLRRECQREKDFENRMDDDARRLTLLRNERQDVCY
jgi:hypothetical protein